MNQKVLPFTRKRKDHRPKHNLSARKNVDYLGPAYRRATENMHRMLNESQEDGKLFQKDVALSCGMTASCYTQKMLGTSSHFYEDEFERIANFYRKRTGRPLTGFPHTPWEVMEACDRQLGWNPGAQGAKQKGLDLKPHRPRTEP